MNGLLAVILLVLFAGIALLIPTHGASAVLFCAIVALVAVWLISRSEPEHRTILLQLFMVGLLLRVGVGLTLYTLSLQEFFGGDALTYDGQGYELLLVWRGELRYADLSAKGMSFGFWGMPYFVAAIYAVAGRNMLAVQFVNAVLGAATAPVIFMCAWHIYGNLRVARISALSVALFPSLVLWSAQGLKDAPIVFLLAVVMLATLKLGERLSLEYIVVIAAALFGLVSLRFYIFYMVAAAAAGAFVIGMRQVSARSLARQFVAVAAIGLALTYLGVLRTAGAQLGNFGNLETMQRSRLDLSRAESGFAGDVDISTTSGALSVIPLGLVYLLFAPFPWQVANLRQSITLPEMLVWWASFPLLCLGLYFTLRYRVRQALPILLFTALLTMAYSVFQGNVGTAYRQRAQLLVFYFIFVAVGAVLLKERREDRARLDVARKESRIQRISAQRYARWREGQNRELEKLAEDLSARQ